MRMIPFLLVVSWSFQGSGAAQVPSIHEDQALFSNLVDNKPLSHTTGVWRETLVNHSNSSLVAFHAVFDCGERGGHTFIDYDPYFDYGDDPGIPPEGLTQILARDPAQCPGGIVAALFSDGHSEGNPEEIKHLYARRRGVYTAIGESIKLLELIATKQDTTQHVMEILKHREDSLTYDLTIDGYERVGMGVTYAKLRSTLTDPHGTIHAPSDHTGARQPLYSHLAETDHISLEQAQAIVLSNKLNEWRSDLEGHMDSPVNR